MDQGVLQANHARSAARSRQRRVCPDETLLFFSCKPQVGRYPLPEGLGAGFGELVDCDSGMRVRAAPPGSRAWRVKTPPTDATASSGPCATLWPASCSKRNIVCPIWPPSVQPRRLSACLARFGESCIRL